MSWHPPLRIPPTRGRLGDPAQPARRVLRGYLRQLLVTMHAVWAAAGLV